MGQAPGLPTWERLELPRLSCLSIPTESATRVKMFSQMRPPSQSSSRPSALNPLQQTAQQRLGLIALDKQDFPEAISHLEIAYQADPGNRNVRKALGYAYGWSGNPQKALLLLAGLPEAPKEMKEYYFWWQAEGRGDLAQASATLAKALNSQRSGATAGGQTKKP